MSSTSGVGHALSHEPRGDANLRTFSPELPERSTFSSTQNPSCTTIIPSITTIANPTFPTPLLLQPSELHTAATSLNSSRCCAKQVSHPSSILQVDRSNPTGAASLQHGWKTSAVRFPFSMPVRRLHFPESGRERMGSLWL